MNLSPNQENVWVTEGSPEGEPREEAGFRLGKGHQVLELSREGDILMTLGEAAVAGDDETHSDGSILVGEDAGQRLVQWINVRE